MLFPKELWRALVIESARPFDSIFGTLSDGHSALRLLQTLHERHVPTAVDEALGQLNGDRRTIHHALGKGAGVLDELVRWQNSVHVANAQRLIGVKGVAGP